MKRSDEINRLIEETVNAAAGSITGVETLSAIGWDSIAAVMFIASVDEKFSKPLDMESLAVARTVADLHALIGTD